MLTAPTYVYEARDVLCGRYISKAIQNLLLDEELEKRQGRTKIRAELAGSCLKAAVYLIVFHRNSSSVYPCREIDMAVFEAPL